MLRLERFVRDAAAHAATRTLTLRYAERCKSRLRVTLDDGTEAGIVLARGSALRAGDVLGDAEGNAVRIEAAEEALYEVRAQASAGDPNFDLLRAAYHLGNRHVPVQLAPGRLRLERDTVLREMLLRIGVQVEDIVAPFEPEAGAYGGGHRHDHDSSGGMLGEQLSREAHAGRVPDYSTSRFEPVR